MTAEGCPDLVQLSSPKMKDFIPPEIAELGLLDGQSGEIDQKDLDTMQAMMKSKAVQCMSLVQDLPFIESVSGNGSLIRLGLPQGLHRRATL